MSYNDFFNNLYQQVRLMIREELERRLNGVISPAGKIDGAAITPGTIPTSAVGHRLQSSVHTDFALAPVAQDGDVPRYRASTIEWVPGPAGDLDDPTTSPGDLIFRNLANAIARLGIGAEGQHLVVVGGVPTWVTPASTGSGTGSLLFFDSEILLFNSDGITFG